jgi:hypothetical protein
MKNKILIYILFVSLVGMIVSWLLWSHPNQYDFLLDTFQSLFFLTGLYLLIRNGTFIQTREFRLIGIGIAVVILGGLFKVMHWVGADQLVGFGGGLIFILYLLHFIKKPGKQLIDIGKLAFLITFLAGRYFKLMHWPKGDELTFLSIMIFIPVVIYFIQSKGMMGEVK